jgi:ornithine decarboxylase
MTTSNKLRRFLDEGHNTPFLAIDLDAVADGYEALRTCMPEADVYYAVKANPGLPLINRLAALGSNFDCASIEEIADVLSEGGTPERISFGNTIKKESSIRKAYDMGVRLFAFDCVAELEKLARSAPGSEVFCRILTCGTGADWPLSRKFGCEPEMATDLLVQAASMGLKPVGVSFHVGSQQKDVEAWDRALASVATVFADVATHGIKLSLINLGGGFPAHYLCHVPKLEEYTSAIRGYLRRRFGETPLRLIFEPGRSLVGDAGVLCSEVVLISKKSNAADEPRWVYLDIGKFGGLAETLDEAIKYRITTPRDGGEVEPVILAGPTCDSADILYEEFRYRMPQALQIGDVVTIHGTGAYTASYSAVNFNGFQPLRAFYI